MTKFTPPVVVRGSRIAEMAEANSLRFFASSMSNSRYAWEEVPRAKIPAWGVYIRALYIFDADSIPPGDGSHRRTSGPLRPGFGLSGNVH